MKYMLVHDLLGAKPSLHLVKIVNNELYSYYRPT